MRLPTVTFICICLAFHVQAADCNKPTVGIETTVCATPSLKDADDAMERVHARAVDGLNGNELDALASEQRDWIDRIEATCAPAHGRVECLAKAIEDRTAEILACHDGGVSTPLDGRASCRRYVSDRNVCPFTTVATDPALGRYPTVVARIVAGVKGDNPQSECPASSVREEEERGIVHADAKLTRKMADFLFVEMTETSARPGRPTPSHFENLVVFDTRDGERITLDRLLPKITPRSALYRVMLRDMDGKLSSARRQVGGEAKTFKDIGLTWDAFPDGWRLDDEENLVLRFDHRDPSTGWIIAAEGTVPRGDFIDHMAPDFRAMLETAK